MNVCVPMCTCTKYFTFAKTLKVCTINVPLSFTLQVTAPLSASLKSGKQAQGLKQAKPLPADVFSAVLLYRV